MNRKNVLKDTYWSFISKKQCKRELINAQKLFPMTYSCIIVGHFSMKLGTDSYFLFVLSLKVSMNGRNKAVSGTKRTTITWFASKTGVVQCFDSSYLTFLHQISNQGFWFVSDVSMFVQLYISREGITRNDEFTFLFCLRM